MFAEITDVWTCACGRKVVRRRGDEKALCSECGQRFNAFGQKINY